MSFDIIKHNIFKSGTPHLQTNPGIGDIINCYIYSSELFDRYPKVKIKVDYGVLYAMRNNNVYCSKLHTFTESLVKRIFIDERYELISESLDTGCIWTHDYPALLDVKFKAKDMSYILKPENKKPDYNYIVINCKIREYSRQNNDRDIGYLIKYLNRFNGKIILMGDKEVNHNKNVEYRAFQNSVYSIYHQLINSLNNQKVIDLTKTELMHDPDIDKFLNEYSLVKHADEVIQIGYSGSYLLSMALNRKTKVICNMNNFVWMAKEYLPSRNIMSSYKEL